MTELRLVGDRYVEGAVVDPGDTFTTDHPFPVEVDVGALARP